jgi:hypothetical protein
MSYSPFIEEEEEEEEHPLAQQSNHVPDVSYWGLDPFYWTYVCLLNCQVQNGLLPNHENWDRLNEERMRLKCNHCFPNSLRVISHVQVMGTLVRKHKNSLFTTYTIDDGTELLDCIDWSSEEEKILKGFELKDPMLGQSLKCFGKLEWPSKKFQVSYKKCKRRLILTKPICFINDINEELFHYHKCLELWTSLYSQPFQLPIERQLQQAQETNVKAYHYGGELEDAVMNLIKQKKYMPLISSMNEQIIFNQYKPFFNICFEFDCVWREEPVASLLLKSIRTSSVQEVHGLLRETLNKLCRSGNIIVMDTKLDLYAILTHEEFLAPAILRTLLKCPSSFVAYNELLSKLREDPRLYCVSNERFDNSLSRLLQDSCIIEGSIGTFGLFSK